MRILQNTTIGAIQKLEFVPAVEAARARRAKETPACAMRATGIAGIIIPRKHRFRLQGDNRGLRI
jgi:hypothetical protein